MPPGVIVGVPRRLPSNFTVAARKSRLSAGLPIPERLTSKVIFWPTARLLRSGAVVESEDHGSRPTRLRPEEEGYGGKADHQRISHGGSLRSHRPLGSSTSGPKTGTRLGPSRMGCRFDWRPSGYFTSNKVYRSDPFDSSEFRLLSASITVMDASCGPATRTPARYPGHPAIAPGVRDQEASHSSAGVGVLRGRPRGRTVRSRPSR